MNVLLVYWGRKGGGAKYAFEMAQALQDLVFLHISISKQSELFENFHSMALPEINIKTFNGKYSFLFRTFLLPIMLYRIAAYCKQNNIDLVYCPMAHVWGTALALTLKVFRIPYILTVHDAELHPGDGGKALQMVLDWEIKLATATVTLTRNVQNLLSSRYLVKQNTIIPHGIFPYFQAKTPKVFPERKFRALFYGRIVAYKGLDLLLDAWRTIEKRFPQSILEIRGSGDITPYQEALSKCNNVSVYNRWINEAENENIFRSCHLCVLPYREASQSGVIAIAFAAAMPVIATPHDGLIEQLENGGGLVCTEPSVDGLVSALTQVMSTPALYERLSSESLTQSQQLQWPVLAKKLTTYFEHITDQKRSNT
ncbi:glycosyltransferase family 4 protein [Chrysiogenes arsenatis]|uniref:glycosyltransferase family 4 protein n=1 Tax=Chrysiogenes arsenatis TaxID=309797 RepID=UPI000413A0FB|nr:glycosyltransferase family 4 protein [Chrysiogenes arsenatis]